MNNFDAVEGLTEEEIFQLYDNIVEGEFVAGLVWDIKCADGRTGQGTEQSNTYNTLSTGASAVVTALENKPNWAFYRVCGPGQAGYGVLVFNDPTYTLTDRYTIWDLRCNNGRSGAAVEDNHSSADKVGVYAYGRFSNSTYAFFRVCGSDEWGYAHLLAKR